MMELRGRRVTFGRQHMKMRAYCVCVGRLVGSLHMTVAVGLRVLGWII